MTAAEFDVRWTGRHAVVRMPDEIDLSNSASMDNVLSKVAAQHPEIITADMTVTVFCDSSGIHALARAHRVRGACLSSPDWIRCCQFTPMSSSLWPHRLGPDHAARRRAVSSLTHSVTRPRRWAMNWSC